MDSIQVNTQMSTNNRHEALPNVDEDVRLTSAEVANLWAAYMSSSIKECMVKYFYAHVEDPEVHNVLEYALHIAKQHLQTLSKLYIRENHPIPLGFTDEDVRVNAPRLFSDNLILRYMEFMAEMRLDGYSTALPMTARTDVRQYFTESLASAAELYNKIATVLISRGQYLRSPYISMPDKVDYVKKQNYITGFLGNRRPLTSIEISHLFTRVKTNFLRKALFTCFGRVARSKQVRAYMSRGKAISSKHIEVMSSLLVKEGLPVPMEWDSGVLDSTVAPFSDRLMSQNIRAFNVVEIGNYGDAISVSLRRDVAAVFVRLMAEMAKYAEDGVNILIDNAWMEEPSQAADKKAPASMLH